ncbi:unnamed protein product [Rotaria socialis]|uniref:Uncharacterized protein n=1 Tax=Rotaria socialis TaxID=392032 RepID=A0A821E0C9_9BILA|nr:unnamed protein product [Rotaria socialis]CAF4628286.1 unnamed protein product [Rotaria socialis]
MSTAIINDYERRFQRSLQKLTIPSWYTDTTPSLSIFNNSKQSINSSSLMPWKADDKETQRIPEVFYVRFPHSSRSCRSSIATSPSPSVHSWHPNYIMEGSRRQKKYQKGIERVSKASRWYQPTQFIVNETTNIPTGKIKVSTSYKRKQQSAKNIHHDTPKIQHNDESLILKSNHLVTNSDVEKNTVSEPTTTMITCEKQHGNHIKSNESQIMPLAITKELSSCIELEVAADEEHGNRSLSMSNNKLIPSITNIPLSIEKNDENDLLERIANDLVESVLSDIFISKIFYDEDDSNSGVRELSEDESGLRELDEDDMNDTDEFIVFPTQLSLEDDDPTSNVPKCSLNKLYTFSKTNHIGSDNSKQTTPSQNSPTSTLEKDVLATDFQSHSTIEQSFDKLCISSPQFSAVDEIDCPSNNQLAKYQLSKEGVNEETARIGRLLLNSIPTTFIEDIHNLSQPPIFTLKTNCLMISEKEDIYDSPRKDYHEIQRGIVEEFDEELNDEVLGDSAYSSNQERINIQQLLYEPLSECFSGFSFIQSDFLTPNISSLQSTTDEAYESEPTTMSSSLAITTYIHPNLEHEFEYPSPPPPVPDRRLKPDYLKNVSTPKSRLTKQERIDSVEYSLIEKSKPLPPPPTTIQQIIAPIASDSNLSSKRTASSRHYCGSIPVSDKLCTESTLTKSKEDTHDKTKEKRNTRVLNCLHPSTADDDDHRKRTPISKSPSTSLHRLKTKKHKLVTDFDEATNGLAIRLPAPTTNLQDSTNKQNLNRITTKRANGITKEKHIIDHIKSDRRLYYETSV